MLLHSFITMKSLFLSLFIAVIMSSTTSAKNVVPCSSPECGQFDFWVGDWDLTYNDTVHATNSITKEMGGCLIHEHFKDPAHKYTGESWSVYSPAKKLWQQTWVDDQGAYIVLTGNFTDGKMILFTGPALLPDGTRIQNSMTFHNITPDSFDWEWESTTDDGKTWKNNWHIHYQRS